MKLSRKTLLSYSLFTIIAIGSFLVAPHYIYAVSVLPVDTLIQQAYLRSQEEDFSALTKSLAQWGNIYDQAYSLARKNTLGSISEAFSSVADNLNAQYECSLSSSDISTIAASDPILNASFAGYTGKPSFAVDNDQLVRSCVRVAQCAKWQDFQEFQLNDNYSQEAYTYCRQVVSQAFTNTISIAAKKNTMDAANRGDDIFYNGSLDDSPFDLLLDMQMIGDVLFKSNTAAPEVILYDFPGLWWAGGSPTYFNPSGNGGTTNAGITFGNTQSAGVSATRSSTAVSTNSVGTSVSVSATQSLNQLSNYHQTVQGTTTTSSPNGASTSTRSNSQSIGANPQNSLVCVTPVGSTQEPTISAEQTATNQIVEAQNLASALSTYNSAINAPAALAQTLRSSSLQQNSPTSAAVANLGSSANQNGSSNNGSTNDPNSTANSCLSRCDGLAPADKAVCQAQCLCGTKYSDNGIFGISVCTVPTAQTEVIGWKTVKTVEEIVDEINAVLTALKNSGQLMKHTKSTEFLDTSLSKIKLNQILSFDMNIAFKPIYDSNLYKDKENAQKSQQQAIADRARQGRYIDSPVGQERNKYIILPNPVKQQQASTNLSLYASSEQTNTLDPSFPYTLAKTLNNDMLTLISDFMSQNALLWQQVADTMNAINTTAGNLEKKIQRGQ